MIAPPLADEPLHLRLGRQSPAFTGEGRLAGPGLPSRLGRVTFESQKLTRRDVDDLEESLGQRLPLAYRELLLEVNGGKVERSYFPLRSFWFPYGRIDRLYGCRTANRLDDVVAWNQTLRGLIPNDFVAIANDGGDAQVVLKVAGDQAGSVWFWDAHRADLDLDGRLFLIAPTFEEFLDVLAESPEAFIPESDA